MRRYRNDITEGDFKVQNITAGKKPVIVAGVKACDNDNGCVFRTAQQRLQGVRHIAVQVTVLSAVYQPYDGRHIFLSYLHFENSDLLGFGGMA